MKARINENGLFLGNYNQDFINENLNKIINGELVSDWVLVDSYVDNFIKPLWNGSAWTEGMTNEELQEIENSKIALHVCFPELSSADHRYIMFDKLAGIKRRDALSNKGLKGKYEYEKDGQLIWSIETKHWFENDSDFPEGIVKIAKLYTIGGAVVDQWKSYFSQTADGKQSILKQQREMILSYFKGQQPELFNMLYTFFATDINNYVAVGNKDAFQSVLTNAKDNHPYFVDVEGLLVYPVRETLSMVIPTQIEGVTTTVLEGILAELV